MFMYPSYSHYFTIFSYVYVSMFLLYFTISFSMFMYPCFYSISPYCYVYVSKLLALFHYTDMLCIQAFYPVSYVSGLFTLFHHIFYVCLCVQAFYPVSYVSELFTLFHHTILYIYVSMRLLYFTILLCLCFQVTCTISLY